MSITEEYSDPAHLTSHSKLLGKLEQKGEKEMVKSVRSIPRGYISAKPETGSSELLHKIEFKTSN